MEDEKENELKDELKLLAIHDFLVTNAVAFHNQYPSFVLHVLLLFRFESCIDSWWAGGNSYINYNKFDWRVKTKVTQYVVY